VQSILVIWFQKQNINFIHKDNNQNKNNVVNYMTSIIFTRHDILMMMVMMMMMMMMIYRRRSRLVLQQRIGGAVQLGFDLT